MKDWLQRKWAAARSQLKAPSVAVDTVSITQGHLRAHITGEAVPRHFEQVHMSLRLGRNYKSLAVDLQGTALPCSAWGGRMQPASDCQSVMSQGSRKAFCSCKPDDAIADVGRVLVFPVRQTLWCGEGCGQATTCDAAVPARLQLRCMSGTPPRTSAP